MVAKLGARPRPSGPSSKTAVVVSARVFGTGDRHNPALTSWWARLSLDVAPAPLVGVQQAGRPPPVELAPRRDAELSQQG